MSKIKIIIMLSIMTVVLMGCAEDTTAPEPTSEPSISSEQTEESKAAIESSVSTETLKTIAPKFDHMFSVMRDNFIYSVFQNGVYQINIETGDYAHIYQSEYGILGIEEYMDWIYLLEDRNMGVAPSDTILTKLSVDGTGYIVVDAVGNSGSVIATYENWLVVANLEIEGWMYQRVYSLAEEDLLVNETKCNEDEYIIVQPAENNEITVYTDSENKQVLMFSSEGEVPIYKVEDWEQEVYLWCSNDKYVFLELRSYDPNAEEILLFDIDKKEVSEFSDHDIWGVELYNSVAVYIDHTNFELVVLNLETGDKIVVKK